MKKQELITIFLAVLGLTSIVSGFYLVYQANGFGDASVSDNQTPPNDDSFCGDNKVQFLNSKAEVEQCDLGDNNGKECTAGYKGTCTYCNSICEQKTIFGDFCGDGKFNAKEGEECDDSNFVNGDGCNNKCELETLKANQAFCGPLDRNSNEILDVSEYTFLSKLNGKTCVDDSTIYSGCGGMDSNNDDKITSSDLDFAKDLVKKSCNDE